MYIYLFIYIDMTHNYTPAVIRFYMRGRVCLLSGTKWLFNPLNAELNPICHLLALLGGTTIVVVSRLRVKCKRGSCYSLKIIYRYFVTETASIRDAFISARTSTGFPLNYSTKVTNMFNYYEKIMDILSRDHHIMGVFVIFTRYSTVSLSFIFVCIKQTKRQFNLSDCSQTTVTRWGSRFTVQIIIA